jgi:hypothetical protein
MLLSQIIYPEGFTTEKIWCPPWKTSSSGTTARGAQACIDCIGRNSRSYISPDECKGCEFKMYRMIGCTCPNEVPAHKERIEW